MITQYQTIRVAFVPGSPGLPRWLSTSKEYRFPKFSTSKEAMVVAKRWIEEAKSGIPSLNVGESYLVVVRKIVVQRSVNAVFAWSPAAGGVIPSKSLSGVDRLLQGPARPKPKPVAIGTQARSVPMTVSGIGGFEEKYTRDVFSIFGLSR